MANTLSLSSVSDLACVKAAVDIATKSAVSWPDMQSMPPVEARAAAFDALPQPVLLVDDNGRIVAANTAMAMAAGWPLSALTSTSWWHLLRPADGMVTSVLPQPGEKRRFTLHGASGQVPVLLRAVATADAPAPLLLVLESPPSGDSTLVMEMAHELRSPLLALNLALAELNAGTATISADEQQRLVNILQRSTVHLQTLLENMLDTASMDANRFHLASIEVDLAEVIEEAVVVVDPLLRPNGQRIDVNLPPIGPIVQGDPQRLRQVLVNLLHNAIKYGPRHQVITVRLQSNVSTATVAVIDRGGAIAPEEQPYLFDRFFRGRAASATRRGNGLGLSIAKAIIEAHGGTIGVDVHLGIWTMFWFRLDIV